MKQKQNQNFPRVVKEAVGLMGTRWARGSHTKGPDLSRKTSTSLNPPTQPTNH